MKKGFTLLELLIVVAIISIIIGITFVALNDSKTKGEDANIKSQAQEIIKALELYYTNNGSYPPDATPGIENSGGAVSPLIVGPNRFIPREPENIDAFTYCASTNGNSYVVFVDLQDTTNDCNIQRGSGAQNVCVTLRTSSYPTSCQIAF